MRLAMFAALIALAVIPLSAGAQSSSNPTGSNPTGATSVTGGAGGTGQAAGQAHDHQAVLAQQREDEAAQSLCRVIKVKADFDKCLELYFLDQDQFQAFLKAHTPAGKH